MAKNFMSGILDELMGRDRDALPTDKPRTPKWDDADVCTHYLVSFCPNELFVNTKADLGPCPKIHDDQLRKRYQDEANSHRKSVYEAEFIRFAEKMISDIEAKIKRGKMRIALANGPDGGTYAGPGSKNAEKIALLSERINALLSEAETAGCDGDVEKAQGLLKLCDQLKDEREQLKSNEVSHPWNPDKAMQVCEVCGSYLIIGEAQHRLDDHIMGKQHVGFAMLRKTMEDVRKNKDVREKDERDKIEREREKRRAGRDSEARARDNRARKDTERKRRSRSRSKNRGEHPRTRDRDSRKSSDRIKRPRSKSRDNVPSKSHHRAENPDRKIADSRERKSSKHSSEDKKRSKRSRSKSRDRHKRKRSRSRSKDRTKRKHHRNHDPEKKEDSPVTSTVNDSTLPGWTNDSPQEEPSSSSGII